MPWSSKPITSGCALTLVIAQGVPAGHKSQVPYNHYSLLRTIETAWGLAPLTANDAAATAMSDFFPVQ